MDNESNWNSGVRFVPAQRGARMVSVRALVERAADQFHQEYGEDHPALRSAVTRTDRLKLVRETVLYVIGIESAQLAAPELAGLIEETYAELFGYGGLDRLLTDDHVTTVTFEGIDKVAARFGFGELEPQERIFEENAHLWTMIRRILRDGDAELRSDHPYYEVGVTHEGRRLCVNLVTPPVASLLTGFIRVHPREMPPLDSFTSSPEALDLLTAIARSPHGLVIVGDPESGKTVLFGILASLADLDGAIAVERAGELGLPDGVTRLRVQWPVGERAGIPFGARIVEGAALNPRTLILDEVRADDPFAILPLIGQNAPARQMWAFRGSPDPKRLAPALGMLARRADTDQADSDARVLALFRRLPFVITVKRRQGSIFVSGIAEWQFLSGENEPPSLVELMTQGWEGLEATGKCPALKV